MQINAGWNAFVYVCDGAGKVSGTKAQREQVCEATKRIDPASLSPTSIACGLLLILLDIKWAQMPWEGALCWLRPISSPVLVPHRTLSAVRDPLYSWRSIAAARLGMPGLL